MEEGDIDEDEYQTEYEQAVKELEDYQTKLSKFVGAQVKQDDSQLGLTSNFTEQMKEREANSIRSKLRALEEERRLKRCSEEEFYKKSKENISLLQKIGATLTVSEKNMLEMDKEAYMVINQSHDSISSSASTTVTSQIKN